MALDLKKLEEKLDKVLSKETTESFNAWLESKGYKKESPVEAAAKDVEAEARKRYPDFSFNGVMGPVSRRRTDQAVETRRADFIAGAKWASNPGERGQEEAWMQIGEMQGDASPYAVLNYIKSHYHLIKK